MDGSMWLLGALVLLPPVGYTLVARHAERHRREPIRVIGGLFLFGGTVAIGMALVLNTSALSLIGGDRAAALLTISIFAAPFIEEACKAIGLPFFRRHVDEPEDGLILGAAVGLGFACSENLLYALRLLGQDGMAASISTTALRAVSSTLLHAVATAAVGYAYALFRLGRAGWGTLAGGYGAAVLMHGTYNWLVQLPEPYIWFGFLTGAGLAMAIAVAILLRIQFLDRLGERAELRAQMAAALQAREQAFRPVGQPIPAFNAAASPAPYPTHAPHPARLAQPARPARTLPVRHVSRVVGRTARAAPPTFTPWPADAEPELRAK